MKTHKLLALSIIFLMSNAARGETPPARPTSEVLLEELNSARMEPELYASYLRSHLDKFIDEYTFEDIGLRIRTNEGKAAVLEAIAYLDAQAAIGEPMTASKGLTLAAKDHVLDLGPKGITGHMSSDGLTTASNRVSRYGTWVRTFGENISFSSQKARGHVINLIVDDGVPSRGHRLSIYNAAFRKAGVACGPHLIYKKMCVIEFAGDYREIK
ncbi:MAG TPA: CAP domain-containing protein [Bacteriovoracaceae bacterium]|nr:CAP domain-containing protein [Bacteriovoracaceae bacterium]